MKSITFKFALEQLSLIKKCFLVVAILCVSASCFANSLNNEKLLSNLVNPKLWQKVNKKVTKIPEDGTFVGYSHNLNKYFGLDLSIDSYVYTNKSDNSFAWVVGFVSKLFKFNYHIDQKEENEYVEFITRYPINKSLNFTGYAGNRNDGTDEYRDYSVGLAYSLNKSVEISAGFADRELKKIDAEGNVFLNINGTF